ncbi:MAG: hypothetical protein H6620_09890 [Halobacteriovoraceae bacterium]|nr:hypothetical protein [Halobacteriovoraceae bacterium]
MNFLRRVNVFLLLKWIRKKKCWVKFNASCLMERISEEKHQQTNQSSNIALLTFQPEANTKLEDSFPTVRFSHNIYLAYRFYARKLPQRTYYQQQSYDARTTIRDMIPPEKLLKSRLVDYGLNEPLTPRELECSALGLCGFTSKQIGLFLGISFRTVEKNLQIAFEKMRCYGKAHCMEIMYTHGLLNIWQDFARTLILGKEGLFSFNLA